MKKYLLVLILTTATATVFAQTVKFGIKGGLNFSNQAGDSYYSSLYTTGFNAGIFADFGLNNFSIRPGISITTKGERFKAATVDNNGSNAGAIATNLKLDYIEVTLNFLYHTAAAPDADIYFGGGPYFAYGVGGSISNSMTSYPVYFKNSNDPTTLNYKNPDIGVNIVAGVILQKKLMIDAGYGLGLTSISLGTASIQNRVISLSVGYLFK